MLEKPLEKSLTLWICSLQSAVLITNVMFALKKSIYQYVFKVIAVN